MEKPSKTNQELVNASYFTKQYTNRSKLIVKEAHEYGGGTKQHKQESDRYEVEKEVLV